MGKKTVHLCVLHASQGPRFFTLSFKDLEEVNRLINLRQALLLLRFHLHNLFDNPLLVELVVWNQQYIDKATADLVTNGSSIIVNELLDTMIGFGKSQQASYDILKQNTQYDDTSDW